MQGTKRKIPIEKRETKEQRAVAFSQRRKGLFKKATDLCDLSDARVAVLATPPSNKSTVVYSFGHTSVDNVVDAFLLGRRPNQTVGSSSRSIPSDPTVKQGNCFRNKKPRSGFWWEQEGVENCQDPNELRGYIERLKKLKENVMIRLKNKREAQIISLGSNSALTIEEIEKNDGSHQILSEMKNNNLGSSSALTVKATEKNIGSHQNLWEVKNNLGSNSALIVQETKEYCGYSHQNLQERKHKDLVNHDFGNGLCLDDPEHPDSSSRDEGDDDFAEILESWCRGNNITIEQSTGSGERFGFCTFSELLN